MKKLLLIIIVLFFQSCYDYYDGSYYSSQYQPILMERSELERSIKTMEVQPLKNTGKIFTKDNYIYIVEKCKGIHVIDNQDRSNPKKVGFIRVPGCIDISMKFNTLYADNAVDLVAIDISSFPTITVTSRVRNVFGELPYPDQNYIPFQFTKDRRPPNTVIVEWIDPNNP